MSSLLGSLAGAVCLSLLAANRVCCAEVSAQGTEINPPKLRGTNGFRGAYTAPSSELNCLSSGTPKPDPSGTRIQAIPKGQGRKDAGCFSPTLYFPLLQGIHHITRKKVIRTQLKTCHYFFFFSTCLFLEIITAAITFKNSRSQATGLLSLENSKLLLCPVYLIDSQHLSGTQSISLSLPLHHSHFWQLNTRSKSSVTQTHDTVNLCNTATLQTAALKAKQKWDLAFQSIFCQKQGGREPWNSSHKWCREVRVVSSCSSSQECFCLS